MSILKCEDEVTSRETVSVAFPFADRAGRIVGAMAVKSVVTFRPLANQGATCGYIPKEPGVTFAFRPASTRDGVGFGATQRRAHFDTEAGRDDALAAYFAKAESRAAAKWSAA